MSWNLNTFFFQGRTLFEELITTLMIIAICTTTVETTIMTWALSMEVKSSPIRDHQEGRRIASQQQTLQR